MVLKGRIEERLLSAGLVNGVFVELAIEEVAATGLDTLEVAEDIEETMELLLEAVTDEFNVAEAALERVLVGKVELELEVKIWLLLGVELDDTGPALLEKLTDATTENWLVNLELPGFDVLIRLPVSDETFKATLTELELVGEIDRTADELLVVTVVTWLDVAGLELGLEVLPNVIELVEVDMLEVRLNGLDIGLKILGLEMLETKLLNVRLLEDKVFDPRELETNVLDAEMLVFRLREVGLFEVETLATGLLEAELLEAGVLETNVVEGGELEAEILVVELLKVRLLEMTLLEVEMLEVTLEFRLVGPGLLKIELREAELLALRVLDVALSWLPMLVAMLLVLGLLVVGLAEEEVLNMLELANNGVETAVFVTEALSGKDTLLVVEALSVEKALVIALLDKEAFVKEVPLMEALDKETSVTEAPLEEALVKEKPVKEVPGVIELFEISDEKALDEELGEGITPLVDAPRSVLLNGPASALLVPVVAELGVSDVEDTPRSVLLSDPVSDSL